MAVVRVFPCVCVDDVVKSIEFYRALLGLNVVVDVGWYAELSDREDRAAMVAFVQRGHPTVPPGFDASLGGVLVSVVVDDAPAIYERAMTMQAPIAHELRDEDFGQRHFMVADPDGFLIDVIEPIRASVEFRRQLVEGRRRWR